MGLPTQVLLTEPEVAVVVSVLRHIVIKSRTGEVGILHGADRFVSTQARLKRPERETLAKVREKLGLAGHSHYDG